MEKELVIHTDGGARGNPGAAACAFVAEFNNKVVEKKAKYLGIATNNFAEYQGVILALRWMEDEKNNADYEVATFFLDSELIVRQILGIYKVKDEKLKLLHEEVTMLIKGLNKNISFKNIPRAKNKEADLLVNQELDSKR